MNSSAASSTEKAIKTISNGPKNPISRGTYPGKSYISYGPSTGSCSLIQVRSNRQQTRRRDVLTELKSVLGNVPSSNRSVLARLPSTPVTLVLKDYIPGAVGVRPLLGALESALRLCQKINQSRQQSREDETYIRQTRTVLFEVRGTLLAAAGPRSRWVSRNRRPRCRLFSCGGCL